MTRDRIAAVALEILEREGAGAVSMRRVASAVGVTPMAIYHHYPDRDALLHAITDAEFAKLLTFIEEAAGRASATPADRLVEVALAYVDYALNRPKLFSYVFSEPRPNARRFPDDFRARRSPTLTPLADAVLEGMKHGYFRRDDEWEVALELWALPHGYIQFYLGGRFSCSEAEFRNLTARAIRRLVDGLRPSH